MKILITEEEIRRRVAELGETLTGEYRGKPLTVIVILNGALLFSADLIRKIDLPLQLDTFAVSSYDDDRSSGTIRIRSELKLPVRGRHVLIVDDILDTGFTMKKISEYFASSGALSVKNCVLMDKIITAPKQCRSDWFGFRIPDEYAVGYGLDSREQYRNLPYIGVLE